MTSSEVEPQLEPGEYPVKAVLGYKYSKTYSRFFFITEWEEKDSKGKHTRSSIPLENFISTPAPIFNFARSLSSTRPCLNRKDRLHLSQRVCASEYIPTGTELIRKIYNAFPAKVKRKEHEFYSVRLWGDKSYHIIRLIHMEYYFPRELLLFWIKHGLSGPQLS
jgi:hypothetical protein